MPRTRALTVTNINDFDETSPGPDESDDEAPWPCEQSMIASRAG